PCIKSRIAGEMVGSPSFTGPCSCHLSPAPIRNSCFKHQKLSPPAVPTLRVIRPTGSVSGLRLRSGNAQPAKGRASFCHPPFFHCLHSLFKAQWFYPEGL